MQTDIIGGEGFVMPQGWKGLMRVRYMLMLLVATSEFLLFLHAWLIFCCSHWLA